MEMLRFPLLLDERWTQDGRLVKWWSEIYFSIMMMYLKKWKFFFFEKSFFYHYFIELGLSLKSFIDGQESFIRIIEEMKETRYCKMLL